MASGSTGTDLCSSSLRSSGGDNSNHQVFKKYIQSRHRLKALKESDRVSHVLTQPGRAQEAVPEESDMGAKLLKHSFTFTNNGGEGKEKWLHIS